MVETKPALLADHVNVMKQTAQRHPQTVCLVAQIISAVGKLSKVIYLNIIITIFATTKSINSEMHSSRTMSNIAERNNRIRAHLG